MVAWLRTLFRTSTARDDLPMSSRVAQMEGDMLAMRSQLDAMHGSLRKLQGKIYRGVSLGDTVEKETPPEEQHDAAAAPGIEMFAEKSTLYKRAAQLRGHR